MNTSAIDESNKPGLPLREELERATALLQNGRIEEAESLAHKMASADPDNGEALYLLAVCQRYTQQHSAALETLSALKTCRPAYGRAYQEEGHVHIAAGDSRAALQAFRHAVSLNSSLIASWKALAELHASEGESEPASNARREFLKLQALPAELLSVRNMTSEGRHLAAENLCRSFLKTNPKHVEAMRLLADLGVKAGVLDDAEFILESAVEFEPDNAFARFDYIGVLYRRQKYVESLKQARILRDSDPDNLDYQISFANQSVAVGDYDTALRIYQKAIDAQPGNAGLHLVHAHALKTVGQLDGAVEAYRRAYTARPSFGDAYWSLANLKTYRFTDDEVAAMRNREDDSSTLLEDRTHFCFALGKHYEDMRSFAEAADYYERGNALRKSLLHYDAEQMTQRLQLQKEVCDTKLLATKSVYGHPAPDPIFIVGLPRSGSTLLEQVLASHSQVDGTLELPNIPALAFRLGGRGRSDEEPKYPAVLRDLTAEQCREYGKAYIEETRVHRADAPFFIDKMPNNFRHIGLIHLILPNAKIIDARRHPMACCFSGFKQLFATGQEFTYGLSEIGTYYRDYVGVMDHWDEVLPGKVLRVQYEDVVADLRTQTERLLTYCDLPFEEACVDYHKTERSIRTPSSEQVRQPIFKSGLEQWREFEPYLDPLKQALGPVLDRYPL